MILAAALCLSAGASVSAESGVGEVDYTTGTPWMDIDLEGNVTADTPTDLKDNYALWANKDRILTMEYPEGYLVAGNSSDVNYKATEDLEELYREDYAAFSEKNEKLAAYFNAMHPWEGQDFNGEAMVGEACADMAALKCMLRIASGKRDFDYDKFFRAYAYRCAARETLDMAMARLEDEHPMMHLRVNTNLQQYDEFLDFYGITEGDNMYLAPEDRVTIW